MHQPSITFLNRVYPPGRGATGRLLRDLARSLAREGWRVTIITTGPQAARERDGSIKVIRIKGPDKPAGILSYTWVLAKMYWTALRQPADDMIVTMTDPPLLAIIGDWLRKRKKAAHIHWCHDVYPDLLPALDKAVPDFAMKYLTAKSLKAMQNADKIIVIGQCMAKKLVKKGVEKKKLAFIPNWPDFELVDKIPARTPREGHHQGELFEDGSSEDDTPRRFRVLYAGSLGLAHPVETIIEAAEILAHEEPLVEFVFVGEGTQYDALAEERSRRHLDNIRLLPYQPVGRLKQIMESGDIHIISMKEAAAGLLVPSKLYAALAAHRPCVFVGPDKCEIADTLKEYNAGITTPQNDPQALAKAILAYVYDGDMWYAAHEGAKAASQIYRPKQSIEAWIKRARKVLEDRN
jgi:glycosyltransferase involved in cell wall biosynthesis